MAYVFVLCAYIYWNAVYSTDPGQFQLRPFRRQGPKVCKKNKIVFNATVKKKNVWN